MQTEKLPFLDRKYAKPTLLLIAILLLYTIQILQKRVDKAMQKQVYGKEELIYIANQGKQAKWLTLGHDALIADIFWIRALGYVIKNLKRNRFPYMFQLFDTITELDPYFLRAYIYGSIFLSTVGKEDYLAEKLLLKGYQKTKHWKIALELASLYQTYLQNKEQALAYYEKAIQSPECPQWYRDYAKRFREYVKNQPLDLMLRAYNALEKSLELEYQRYLQARQKKEDPTLLETRHQAYLRAKENFEKFAFHSFLRYTKKQMNLLRQQAKKYPPHSREYQELQKRYLKYQSYLKKLRDYQQNSPYSKK